MMCHFWPTEVGQKGEVRGRHIAVPVPELPADIYSGKCPHTAAAIEKGTHVSCQIWFNEPKPELPHRHMGSVLGGTAERPWLTWSRGSGSLICTLCGYVYNTYYWFESVWDFRKKFRNVPCSCKYPAVENIHLYLLPAFISFAHRDTSWAGLVLMGPVGWGPAGDGDHSVLMALHPSFFPLQELTLQVTHWFYLF